MTRLFLRSSLWLLLPVALLFALEMLLVGLFFAAPVLFTWDRPFAVTLWAAQVLFPAFIIYALTSTAQKRANHTEGETENFGRDGRLYLLTALAWLFAAFSLFVLWWEPNTYGGPWGW